MSGTHSRTLQQPLPKVSGLRPWQLEALAAWERGGRRGIVAAATGTGKTKLALACMAAFFAPGRHILIVVPSISLLGQWVGALRSEFGLAPHQIGTFGGAEPTASPAHSIIVGVINSGRRAVPRLVRHWTEDREPVMLIVDECHWAGAAQNSQVLHHPVAASLGLSATPERPDSALSAILEPALGPVCFRYTLRQALDDGVLSPLRLVDVLFDLPSADAAQLTSIHRQLSNLWTPLYERHPQAQGLEVDEIEGYLRSLGGASDIARRVSVLLRERRALLTATTARRQIIEEIVVERLLDGRRSIIFHERRREAEETFRLLTDAGARCTIERSDAQADERMRSLEMFRQGVADTLVVVRTADEGIDIPAADFAVIVNGMTGPRQRLQRIGRVVRPSDQEAVVISLLARGSAEERVALRDRYLVGPQRVQYHRWPAVPIADAITKRSSSYEVSDDTYS